jgi:N-acetylglucosaminyl-diphospho-decaprenol L-rhamnosyltransferase
MLGGVQPERPDVSVVVVTLNGLTYIERCLDSVSEYELVVVDHGSTDGTLDVVRDRFPDAIVVEQENRGFAAGVNAGMQAGNGRYFLLLNPDAWAIGDAVARLVEFADQHPDSGVVGPRLRNEDGSPQGSIRGFPTLWRLITQYLFLAKLAPRTRLFNAFYGGNRPSDKVQDTEFLTGACLLIRRAAFTEVGPFDEDFFMFAEEADWCLRCRERGWRVTFFPDSEVVHVGEATTKSVWSYERTYREQERSHLRFLVKHDGLRTAERARRVIAFGYILRAMFGPRGRTRAYARVARWLFTGTTLELLSQGR